MIVAVLVIITKTWNPPKCPSTEEWIKKIWHIYTMGYCCCCVTSVVSDSV